MTAAKRGRRKRSTRVVFCAPPWDESHPEYRRIDSVLPANHHVRWMAEVVSHLDLGPLRRSYANRGSQANNPDLLLPFVLYMYSQGILSPSDWADEALYDDRAKWLLKGLQPARSQLYEFRARLAPFLLAWHKQLIAFAIANRITSGKRASLDGTFVASLASRHRLMGRRVLLRRLLRLRLAVWLDDFTAGRPCDLPQEVFDWAVGQLLIWTIPISFGLDVPCPLLWPAWMPNSVAGRQRVLARYLDAWKRLRQRLEPLLNKQGPLSKKEKKALGNTRVSLTDDEAVLGWDKVGTFRPLFNVALVQATDAPLTLAWEVFCRNNDQGLLRPMMQKAKEQNGAYPEEVLVDGGFVNIADLLFCEQENIVVYSSWQVPQHDKTKKRSKSQRANKLSKKEFRYDAKENVYHCPQGKRLEFIGRHQEERQGGGTQEVLVYKAKVADCRDCSRRTECTSSNRGRVVKRYQGEEVLQRLEARMKRPASQKIYRLRGQSVELGYADIKEHRGLRNFKSFGLNLARIQAGMVILASNGLKIINALRRRQTPPNLRKPPSVM